MTHKPRIVVPDRDYTAEDAQRVLDTLREEDARSPAPAPSPGEGGPTPELDRVEKLAHQAYEAWKNGSPNADTWLAGLVLNDVLPMIAALRSSPVPVGEQQAGRDEAVRALELACRGTEPVPVDVALAAVGAYRALRSEVGRVPVGEAPPSLTEEERRRERAAALVEVAEEWETVAKGLRAAADREGAFTPVYAEKMRDKATLRRAHAAELREYADEIRAGAEIPPAGRPDALGDVCTSLSRAATLLNNLYHHVPDDWRGVLCNVRDDALAVLRSTRIVVRALPPAGEGRPRARPEEEWSEEDGPALWWSFPVKEPPYVGTPLDTEFPCHLTHWTPLPPTPAAPSGEPDPITACAGCGEWYGSPTEAEHCCGPSGETGDAEREEG